MSSANATIGGPFSTDHGSGTATVSGTGSSWTITTGDFRIGNYGTGVLNILDGGKVTSDLALIGGNQGGSGTVTVNNGNWTTVNRGLVVGSSGEGTLSIENGATVTNATGAQIGYGAGITGTATVTDVGSTWKADGDLIIGASGTGNLTVEDGGQLTSQSGLLGRYNPFGNSAGGIGTVTINNARWNAGSGNFIVGQDGTGTLTIENGGTLSSGLVTIGKFGRPLGSSGTATVTGAGSSWTSSGNFVVGGTASGGSTASIGQGDGTLNISAGGAVSNINGYIGSDANAIGKVNVSGAGSTWTNNGTLVIGANGSGTLNISNGGIVTNTRGFIGEGSTGTGAVTVTGSDSMPVTGSDSTWANSGDLSIGFGSDGTLNISAGGAVSNVNSYIGDNATAIGVANVSGAGSTWSNSGTLTVGRYGEGTLNISNEGVVSNTLGYIGRWGTGTGAVIITGVGSQWDNSSDLMVGDDGNGTLSILNGATVTSADGSIGAYETSVGTATVDGSNSTWTNSGTFTVGDLGVGTLTVTNGGAVRNDDGFVGRDSDGIGHVTVTGSGSTWNNFGTLNVGTAGVGELNISSGGEVIAESATIGSTGRLSGDSLLTLGGEVIAEASATIGSTGRLSGDSLLTLNITDFGPGTLTNSGTIAPGNSIGTLTVDGNVVFASDSTFEVEIDNAGNSDLLDVSGAVTINSGSTIAVNSNGETITDGKRYTLIKAASITGAFDTLDTALVTWDTAVTSYEMAYDATTAALVVGVPSVTPFDSTSLLRTYNQRAAGGAIQQISATGATLGGITAALQGIVNTDSLLYAYDQLSGQTRPSLAPITRVGLSSYAAVVMRNGRAVRPVEADLESKPVGHDYYFWVEGLGAAGERDSKEGVNGSDYDSAGVATGIDNRINNDLRVGASLGYLATDVDYGLTRDNSRINSTFGAIYSHYTGFDGYVDAMLSYADLDNETDRYVDFVGQRNQASFNGYAIFAAAEAAKNYSYQSYLVQPILGFEYSYQHQDGYSETGSASALRYGDQTFESYKSSLGVRTSKYFFKRNNQSLWGQFQLAWVHEFGDSSSDMNVNFVLQPNQVFTIRDADINRDSAVLSVGLKYQPKNNTLLFADYAAQFNNDAFNQTFNIGLRVSF